MRMHKISGIVMLVMFLLAVIGVPVSAETAGTRISIPVSVRGAQGTVVLETAEADTPLPDKSELQIPEDGKQDFGPVFYEKAGDYHYKIWQRTGNETNVRYDHAVYDVTVRVVNVEGKASEAVVWCQKEGTEGKADGILFTNEKKEEVRNTTPVRKMQISGKVKTGDIVPVGILSAMCGISAGILTAVEKWKRKKDK